MDFSFFFKLLTYSQPCLRFSSFFCYNFKENQYLPLQSSENRRNWSQKHNGISSWGSIPRGGQGVKNVTSPQILMAFQI